jgi:hypothetical protein
MAADMELIESIRRVEQDIRQARDEQKELNTEFVEAIKELPEYEDVQTAARILQERRTDLAAAIKRDEECEMLRSQLDEGNAKMKDLREILSHNLVRYHESAQSTSLPEAESKKVRQIILTAKLGQPEFVQEELFTGDVEVSNGEGEVIHRSAKAQARVEAEEPVIPVDGKMAAANDK